jgi:hypothetical protein
MSRVAWNTIGLCIIGLMMMLLNACENPFKTREPEPPSQARSTWILPFSPEIVFVNLRNAMVERNVVNYERCFSDSTRPGGWRFRFIAEATVANENPDKFANWGVKQERDYFSQLRANLPEDSTRSLVLRPDSLQTVITGDSAIFLHRYELTVRHKLQSCCGVPGKVSGEGRFWLSKDQFGEWSIYRWADFASGGAFTWSRLKADFLQ